MDNLTDGGLRKKGVQKNNYKKTLISIITVVLNNKKGLEKTINSVINQNYDNIEYIIIDGGSTDGTIDLVKKFENQIDYYISEKDHGIYDAMNKGLSFATGDYILMLNSGDYLCNKNTIQKVVKNIQRYPADIVYGKVYYIDEKTKKKFINWDVMKDYNFFNYNTSLPHQATFIHKKVYNLLGSYDIKHKICADAIFTYIAKLYNFNFKFINIVVSYYETGGISSQTNIYLIESFLFLYKKGIWDKDKLLTKIYGSFKDEEIELIFNKYKESLQELNINQLLNNKKLYKNDILIVNDIFANPFNKNIINIFSIMGYKTKCSVDCFFLNFDYKILIIEWEEYLLHEKFYPINTSYDERLNILLQIINNYKNKGTKIIGILHNKIDHEYLFDKELYNKNYNLKKTIFGLCDTVIHLGSYSYNEFKDFYQLNNIKNYIIPHPLYYNYNIKYNISDSKKILKIKQDNIVIGVFGAIRHQDEYDLIISTFNKLNIKKKKLLLVGGHKKNIIFHNSKDCIIINNFVDDNEMYSVYLNASDIVFLPRLYSLNSGVLFLALSFSKIIVGPDTGNMGEYLKMFGYPVFNDIDNAPNALQKGIDLLKFDPDIVYRNRIKAENLFSNYELSKMWKQVFDDLEIDFQTKNSDPILESISFNYDRIEKKLKELSEQNMIFSNQLKKIKNILSKIKSKIGKFKSNIKKILKIILIRNKK